jgi:hypothetical protein
MRDIQTWANIQFCTVIVMPVLLPTSPTKLKAELLSVYVPFLTAVVSHL